MQANISNTAFHERSPRPPEVGVLLLHIPTDRQTDRHGDSMTESAQWANSVREKNVIYKSNYLRKDDNGRLFEWQDYLSDLSLQGIWLTA